MIDPHLLRDDPDRVRASLRRRGRDGSEVDRLVELDGRRRELIAAVDDARAEQKTASKAIGQASPDDRTAMIEQASQLKEQVADLEQQLDEVVATFEREMAAVPNVADDAAPEGREGDGVVLKTVGDKPRFDFEAKDHVDLMVPAGALDLERGAQVSGSRFAYLLGDGALLELALVRYAMDIAVEHGHTPAIPPVLVREEAMYGTGFLPTDEQQIFRTDDRDDLYLVGTAEVPLAALHLDELLDPGQLPDRYVGFSSAFRREAGTYGKDTRGIFRVHQFDKVELFSFVEPDASRDEHERILAIEEEVMTGLELHFRIVDIPVGDLGAPAARKFDIEAWLPGQDAYRELTSCSNTTDYQARRLKARVRRGEGGNELVHTLNGTALAVQRTIIALAETHQRADGSVGIPEKLQPYLGRERIFAGE